MQKYIGHSPTHREIDRSLTSVCIQCYGSFNNAKSSMGLKTYNNAWTKYDIEYMGEHYHNMTNQEISKNITHGVSSIAHKAMEIGLSKDKEFIKKITSPTQFKKGSIPNNGFTSENTTGKNNPFYGKHHTKETRERLSIANRGRRIGKDNNKWKGGITKNNEKIRKLRRYKMWQNEVYRRDGYTCQLCGDNSGGNLVAHHIIYFHRLIGNNNIKSLDDAYKCNALWDLENGVTLCEECHRILHKKKEY